jgi:hypothetical protein
VAWLHAAAGCQEAVCCGRVLLLCDCICCLLLKVWPCMVSPALMGYASHSCHGRCCAVSLADFAFSRCRGYGSRGGWQPMLNSMLLRTSLLVGCCGWLLYRCSVSGDPSWGGSAQPSLSDGPQSVACCSLQFRAWGLKVYRQGACSRGATTVSVWDVCGRGCHKEGCIEICDGRFCESEGCACAAPAIDKERRCRMLRISLLSTAMLQAAVCMTHNTGQGGAAQQLAAFLPAYHSVSRCCRVTSCIPLLQGKTCCLLARHASMSRKRMRLLVCAALRSMRVDRCRRACRWCASIVQSSRVSAVRMRWR